MHPLITPARALIAKRADLDGQLLGDLVRSFVFESPEVQAAREILRAYNRTKAQIAAFDGVFNRGLYLWPLHLTFKHLNGLFRPHVLADEEWTDERWGELPSDASRAFDYIADSFASAVRALRSGSAACLDLTNNRIPAQLWQRPGIAINVENSDLHDIGGKDWKLWSRDPQSSILLRGVRLFSADASVVDGSAVEVLRSRHVTAPIHVVPVFGGASTAHPKSAPPAGSVRGAEFEAAPPEFAAAPPMGDPPAVRLLQGLELDKAIREALKFAVDAAPPKQPLNGKQQVTEAMKILRSRHIKSRSGRLQERVQELANAEFEQCRNARGVRLDHKSRAAGKRHG